MQNAHGVKKTTGELSFLSVQQTSDQVAKMWRRQITETKFPPIFEQIKMHVLLLQ